MKKKKKILILIDCQYDFMMEDGKLSVPGAEALIAPGIKYLSQLDPEEYEAVIFTGDDHEASVYAVSEEATRFPNIHCERGTPGAENVFNPRLIPKGIPVYTLKKTVHDMWEEKDILLVPLNSLTEIGYDRDEFFDKIPWGTIVEIWGVATDYCVKMAIDGTLYRGLMVQVKKDLVLGISRQIDDLMANEYKNKSVTLI